VRSATRMTRKELTSWDGLKVVGRAGVGLDNIDLETSGRQGIQVVNTPEASSRSVAELVLGHLFAIARSIHRSNREMPVSGTTEFNTLKKRYSKGVELRGKTIGIIGLGRIGRALAGSALGLGMEVVAHDPYVTGKEIELSIPEGETVRVPIKTVPLAELLQRSDLISLHVPKPKEGALISTAEFEQMKTGVRIVNASRGGVIDEDALLQAIGSGKVAAAALDVFENEPVPKAELVRHPAISVTPHIGASTLEAQERIGVELAEKVIRALA